MALCRQSRYLWTPSRPWVPPVWTYCCQAWCRCPAGSLCSEVKQTSWPLVILKCQPPSNLDYRTCNRPQLLCWHYIYMDGPRAWIRNVMRGPADDYVVYTRWKTLSNGQQQTGSNAGLEVNCITLIDQTPTLTARLSGPSCWHNTWAVPRPAWMRGPADDYDSPNIENFPDFWTGRDVR